MCTQKEHGFFKPYIDPQRNKRTLERIGQAIAENGGLCGLDFWLHSNIPIERTFIDDLFLSRGDFELLWHDCTNGWETEYYIEEINWHSRAVPWKRNECVVIFDKPELLRTECLMALEDMVRNNYNRHIAVIFITTKDKWEGRASFIQSQDWDAIKERCIYCPIEMDVL